MPCPRKITAAASMIRTGDLTVESLMVLNTEPRQLLVISYKLLNT